MAQYIDKSALVSEIERRRDAALTRQRNLESIGQETVLNEMIANELNKILSFLNTLEVKEVDLDEELDEWMKYGPHTDYPWCTIPDAIKITAEHFFELGLKAQKGE
jgi:hypothetical protein